MKTFLTAESVSDGHPDKLCDQISDALLDACLEQDPNSRVAAEVAIKDDSVLVLGEVTSAAQVELGAVVRGVLADAGYGDPRWGLDLNGLMVIGWFSGQSPDIAAGVSGIELGAGDQGICVGYATDETPERLPLPVVLAHRLMVRHREVRRAFPAARLGPDAKAQVTVEYGDGIPRRIDTVIVSTQHEHDLSLSALSETVIETIVRPSLPEAFVDRQTRILVNPAGSFVVGGPKADSGLTGRKLMVDTYGPAVPHGGGAFSGKDGTKVDRSGAYAARQVARALVDAGWARRVEIQVAYAIGQAKPVMVQCRTHGTGRISDDLILARAIPDVTALLRPSAIIDHLGLRRPIFRRTATFGHFGREGFPWEAPLASGLPAEGRER